jgi:hypothetical protein
MSDQIPTDPEAPEADALEQAQPAGEPVGLVSPRDRDNRG